MQIKLTPSDFLLKEARPTFSIFGVGLVFENVKYKELMWEGHPIVDIDGRVPLKPQGAVNGSSMIANINYDFTERQYTIEYVGINDVLSRVGGMRSSVLPIIALLVPYVSLYFLVLLADIIREAAAKK